jgi:hypothetical protein
VSDVESVVVGFEENIDAGVRLCGAPSLESELSLLWPASALAAVLEAGGDNIETSL